MLQDGAERAWSGYIFGYSFPNARSESDFRISEQFPRVRLSF